MEIATYTLCGWEGKENPALTSGVALICKLREQWYNIVQILF